MTTAVEVHAYIEIEEIEREALSEVFFAMGEVLVNLENEVDGVIDHAVSVDLGAKSLEIEVTTRGETLDDADSVGRAAILFAMAATGGRPADADQLMNFIRSGGAQEVDLLAPSNSLNVSVKELVLH